MISHPPSQRTLDQARIEEFHHDLFGETQVQHFMAICAPHLQEDAMVADVGGGYGFCAPALMRAAPLQARVIDSDEHSVAKAHELGVQTELGNALAPVARGDEAAVCFNLNLHHLVAGNGAQTQKLQRAALQSWKDRGVLLFVHEYIYESYLLRGFSGWVIRLITSSRLLSALAATASRLVPSLRANTFGVGVRFREAAEWREVFESKGWKVVAERRGDEEPVSAARRLLHIRSCRRDSFVLASEA